MKHLLPTMVLMLVLPAWGHAIEVYQSKPIEVQRDGLIAERRAADIPVDQAREVEVSRGTSLTVDDAAPLQGKRSPGKGTSLVKGVENAAAIDAQRELCALPEQGIREKLLAHLAKGHSANEVASYADIFDATRTAAVQKAKLARKKRQQALCNPEAVENLNSATDTLLAKLENRPAPPAASAAVPAPLLTPTPPSAPKKSPPPPTSAAGGVDYLYTTYQCYRLGFNGQSMITNVVFTLKRDGTYIDPVNRPGRYRLDQAGHVITFLDGNLKPAKGSYEQMRDGGPRVYLSYDESGWSGLNCAKR